MICNILKESEPKEKLLPVTLLSGFLGSGKTTLLKHILQSNSHGLRIAVLINDMGEINIDADLIAKHGSKLMQQPERVVEMQNGCICCTLREDLLEEVAKLAAENQFDYLIIESTGISEPIQVAETFTTDFSEAMLQLDAEHREELAAQTFTSTEIQAPEMTPKLADLLRAGGLSKLARLDTCVTMVDCVNLFSNFDTYEFLSDRYGADAIAVEDERNITDLLVDQIEFANVIILNKCDVASDEQVSRARRLVHKLNPSAEIFTTQFSKVDIGKLVGTNKFSFDQAASGAGWLKSLQEMSANQRDGKLKFFPLPETEEYHVSSFVYRARRPFEPERLWNLIKDIFIVQQMAMEEDEGSEADESDSGISSQANIPEPEHVAKKSKPDGDSDEDEDDVPQLDTKARLASKRADPVFSRVLRSKGFLWLATRPLEMGEWSQAGCMLTIGGGGLWFANTPEDDWNLSREAKRAVKQDFQGEWGDRRQEIVVIGENIDKEAIKKRFDAALLKDDEWRAWQKLMRSRKTTLQQKLDKLNNIFEDGFEDWMSADDHDHAQM